MPWLPVLHTSDDNLMFFANRILPQYRVVVAERDGAVRGFSSHEGWLEQLYILPPAWRQGIGTILLDNARVELDFLQLRVFERNTAARAFCHRHDFEVAERTNGSNNEKGCPDARTVWRRDT